AVRHEQRPEDRAPAEAAARAAQARPSLLETASAPRSGNGTVAAIASGSGKGKGGSARGAARSGPAARGIGATGAAIGTRSGGSDSATRGATAVAAERCRACAEIRRARTRCARRFQEEHRAGARRAGAMGSAARRSDSDSSVKQARQERKRLE